MNTAGVVILVLFLLLIAAGVGWIVFTRLRAQRLGLPPPSLLSYIPFFSRSSSSSPYGPPQPAPGGIVGWVNDRIRMFKNRNNRSATGAYEGAPPTGTRGRRGFGPLDPDEAWDTSVGHEADLGYGPGGYYEEQELGLHPSHATNTGYGGEDSSYQMNLATPAAPAGSSSFAGEDERGRTRSRSPAYNTAPPAGRNPFDDDAEPSNISMRGVSPRPMADAHTTERTERPVTKDGDSPTERRSIFREEV
ncbi:hypothetical protein QBC46DRAFT_262413 [Diplogelasinospora grovesii]|uniref:Acid phosphatase-like protein n=1 Tax=Diplogelasinospora grovesii TaxID=303347 RepID=A0AAN6S460_9PEZI|nr:hypothetical protein QBC46DRAFT_262413 [Diplogelasinospora grovesii]